jgi:hypothetical protein
MLRRVSDQSKGVKHFPTIMALFRVLFISKRKEKSVATDNWTVKFINEPIDLRKDMVQNGF